MHAVLSTATVTLPVLAPSVVAESGLAFSLLGLFVVLVYASSMTCSLMSGALIRRWGPLRLSQLCLLSASAGASAGDCSPRLDGCSCVLLGVCYGPLNPASSHLLTRVAPPQHLSKIFSLKQTGVPLGAVYWPRPCCHSLWCGLDGDRRCG